MRTLRQLVGPFFVFRLDLRCDARWCAPMIGQRVCRRQDSRFLTGNGRYVDDLELPGALNVAFVRSDLAHARIVEIDASEAAARPGVQVPTAADIDLGVLGAPFPGIPELPAVVDPVQALRDETVAQALFEEFAFDARQRRAGLACGPGRPRAVA